MQRITSDRPLLIGLVILGLIGSLGIAGAASMQGLAFPGFLVLSNGVVASATVPGWPATEGGTIYQHQVITVDGRPVIGPGDVYRIARQHPVGSPLVYRFRDPIKASVFERTIMTQSFSLRDASLLFGVYLLNGIALAGAALLVWVYGKGTPAARSTLPFLLVGSLWGLSAMDLYGPYRLFRFHVLCEALLAPAILQMALGFPREILSSSIRSRLIVCFYTVAGCMGLSYLLSLDQPAAYVQYHLLATALAGLSLAFFVASQIWRFGSNRLANGRRPSSGILLGTVAALLLPALLSVGGSLTGGQIPQSSVGFSVFVFPLAVAHATTRGRLFDPLGMTSEDA